MTQNQTADVLSRAMALQRHAFILAVADVLFRFSKLT